MMEKVFSRNKISRHFISGYFRGKKKSFKILR